MIKFYDHASNNKKKELISSQAPELTVVAP